jgi:hypothetical protein
MRNKGQVTIFIILAILIVFGVLIALFFNSKHQIDRPNDLGPTEYVQSCVTDALEPVVQTILDNGGRINPYHYVDYKGEKYNYLCFQADYYISCYNTHPMLELIVENEIREESKSAVQECFNQMKEDFEDRGYSISGGSTNYSIDLLPGEIKVLLTKKMVVSKDGIVSNYEDFSTSINSPLYDLIRIAREIVNSESQYCNFEYNGFMILYPEYSIKRNDYSDNKLYQVIDRQSGYDFRFAIRNCAFPPGI